MLILDLLMHRYIRVGDTLWLSYSGGLPIKTKVTKIDGFGRYAAVRTNSNSYGAIRRDQIVKDGAGNWVYRYDD